MENTKTNSLDDVFKAIKKISVRVTELINLSRMTRDQMRVVAGVMFEIRDDSAPKQSPEVNTSPASVVRIRSIEKLRKNYSVLRDLFETKNELDAMESKLRTSRHMKDVDRAVSEIQRIRSEVLSGISEAFSFIAELAKSHMPAKMDTFSRAISAAVEKSIIYREAKMYSYIFEADGDLCFTVYLHLIHAEDESGKIFPELFLTMTYRTGATPQMYVGIQHHFTPPSADLLMKKVKSVKDALQSYNHLLELDSFDNTFGSLPLDVLLSPKSIVKDAFSFSDKVRSIEVGENEIIFHTKSNALPVLHEMTAQLYKELNSVQRRSNAKLRMSVRKARSSAEIAFRFVVPSNAPPVDATDLEFLKDRFNVDESSLKKIAQIINIGS